MFPTLSVESEFVVPFMTHDDRQIFELLDNSDADTLVGWSLGAHLILKRWSRVVDRFKRIILVAPFLDAGHLQNESMLRVMRAGLASDMIGTVQQYQKLSGFPGQGCRGAEDADKLAAGLSFMMDSQAMPSHMGADKTTLIHGEYDRIVNPLASEDIWQMMPSATYVAVPHGHWVPENEIIPYL